MALGEVDVVRVFGKGLGGCEAVEGWEEGGSVDGRVIGVCIGRLLAVSER